MLPTAGNDLILIVAFGTVGLALGILGGSATHVRTAEGGSALARVGWARLGCSTSGSAPGWRSRLRSATVSPRCAGSASRTRSARRREIPAAVSEVGDDRLTAAPD